MFHVFYFQIIEDQRMNSSDDELPDIPGTKYPWMNLEDDDGRDEDSRQGATSQPRYSHQF